MANQFTGTENTINSTSNVSLDTTTIEGPSNDKAHIKKEALEIFEELEFAPVDQQYVLDVFNGKIQGYITTIPDEKSKPPTCNICIDRNNNFYKLGMLSPIQGELIYTFQLDLEFLTLDGAYSLGNGRSKMNDVFVSKGSVENARIAKLYSRRAGNESKKEQCITIGNLSEVETLKKVREIAKSFYKHSIAGLTIATSNLSHGVGSYYNDYYQLANEGKIYSPTNPDAFLKIYKR